MKTAQKKPFKQISFLFLIGFTGIAWGACSRTQFGGGSGTRSPGSENGVDKNGNAPGSNPNGTNGGPGSTIPTNEDIMNSGKLQPGNDGISGTQDDYVQRPGQDGQMGTNDDTATFAGPDGKFGTSDDKTVLAGPDGKFGTEDDIVTANPPPAVGAENWETASCVKGDKIEFEWTGPIKDCFKQGKTWDFDTSTCVEIRAAKFTCDWATVTEELTKAELLTPVIQAAPGSGAKLISCGQSQDGKRIVVQFVKEPSSGKVDCKNIKSAGAVTTGCYTDYSPNPPPPIPTDPEERKKQVYGCLNKL